MPGYNEEGVGVGWGETSTYKNVPLNDLAKECSTAMLQTVKSFGVILVEKNKEGKVVSARYYTITNPIIMMSLISPPNLLLYYH